jgi:hypothetical protein
MDLVPFAMARVDRGPLRQIPYQQFDPGILQNPILGDGLSKVKRLTTYEN